MAIDFPNSPTLNQVFTSGDKSWTWDGEKWIIEAQGVSLTSINVSDTAPSPPVEGDLWFDSDTAKTYVYYDSAWVEIGGIGSTINEATLEEAGTVYGYQDGPLTFGVTTYSNTYALPGVLTINWATGTGSYAGNIAAEFPSEFATPSDFVSGRPFMLNGYNYATNYSFQFYGSIISYSESSFVFSFNTSTSYTTPSQATLFDWSNDVGMVDMFLSLTAVGGNTVYGESTLSTNPYVGYYANTIVGASAGSLGETNSVFSDNVFIGTNTTIKPTPSTSTTINKNVVIGSEAFSDHLGNIPAPGGGLYSNVFIGGDYPAYGAFYGVAGYPNITSHYNTFINPQGFSFDIGSNNIEINGKIVGRAHTSGYTHLTYPNQPYVQLRGNGASNYTPVSGLLRNNQPSGFTWSTIRSIGGGLGWNATNGSITAPQSGVYLCSFSTYIISPAFGNYMHLTWAVNGSISWNGGNTPYNIFGHHTDAGRLADGAVVTMLIYLNKNDTLGMAIQNGSAQFTGSYTYMSFYFLG